MPILQGASETGQADHDTLHTAELQVLSQLPAKVSSTEQCQLTDTQWTLYRGVVERSLRVNQGRHGECLQGNVVCWEIVASLCCGLVVREAADVVSCRGCCRSQSLKHCVVLNIGADGCQLTCYVIMQRLT